MILSLGTNSWIMLASSGTKAGYQKTVIPVFGTLALFYLIYPLAGFVADVICGRYKTVIVSLWCIWIGTVAGSISALFLIPELQCLPVYIVYGLLAGIPTLLLLFGLCGFQANVIQFGTDQLHDATSDELSILIHWFVWTLCLADGITIIFFHLMVSSHEGTSHEGTSCEGTSREGTSHKVFSIVLHTVLVVLCLLFTVSLCFSCCFRRWFVDFGSHNPYKLVYKVLRFAAKNKLPLNRSAFTYSEDEIPSRIDFAKEKYGGPFTTEEVEDVRTLLGILPVLLTFGLIFCIAMPAEFSLPSLAVHLEVRDNKAKDLLFNSGLLTPLFVVVFIPLYICVLRPLIYYHVPGMLKRIGLGLILLLVCLAGSFAVDTVGHAAHRNATCFLSVNYTTANNSNNSLEIYGSAGIVVTEHFLTAIAFMLINISIFEFVCAQSPHSMKGLLIGSLFALMGLFKLLGLVVVLPFMFRWKPLFPSCGFGYYLVNVFIAIVGLVVYTVAARRYKYRQRDDVSSARMYIENYYEPYDSGASNTAGTSAATLSEFGSGYDTLN